MRTPFLPWKRAFIEYNSHSSAVTNIAIVFIYAQFAKWPKPKIPLQSYLEVVK